MNHADDDALRRPGGRKAAQAAATRRALIDSARRHFGERGYAATSIEAIHAGAGVTRGALYHHFAGKADLFRAVFLALEEELAAELQAAAAGSDDPWQAVLAGADRFLDLCTDRAFARIALVDGPAVLGWTEWRAIELRYGLGLVLAAVEGLQGAGLLAEGPPSALAHALHGALMESAMVIATAHDPAAARAEAGRAMRLLLAGLRGP